jgi:hypothetical protein
VLAGSEGDDRAARALVATNYKQFAPRAGFAYLLPGDKTVVRGGAGIFYGNMITVGGMSSLEINPPNHVRVAQTTDRTIPSIFLSQGFAPDALSVANARDVTSCRGIAADKQPTAYQWNVNTQRELPGQVVVEVGYYYNRLVNNWRSIDGNPAPPGPGNLNRRRLYQTTAVPPTGDVITLANVTRIQKDGWSQYHRPAGEVREALFEGDLAACGLHVVGNARTRGGYQDYTNIDAEVGPTSTDRPHTSSGAAFTSCRSAATGSIGR